jgi:hypothetical protein
MYELNYHISKYLTLRTSRGTYYLLSYSHYTYLAYLALPPKLPWRSMPITLLFTAAQNFPLLQSNRGDPVLTYLKIG